MFCAGQNYLDDGPARRPIGLADFMCGTWLVNLEKQKQRERERESAACDDTEVISGELRERERERENGFKLRLGYR
jgi:hypothetical protein